MSKKHKFTSEEISNGIVEYIKGELKKCDSRKDVKLQIKPKLYTTEDVLGYEMEEWIQNYFITGVDIKISINYKKQIKC